MTEGKRDWKRSKKRREEEREKRQGLDRV